MNVAYSWASRDAITPTLLGLGAFTPTDLLGDNDPGDLTTYVQKDLPGPLVPYSASVNVLATFDQSVTVGNVVITSSEGASPGSVGGSSLAYSQDGETWTTVPAGVAVVTAIALNYGQGATYATTWALSPPVEARYFQIQQAMLSDNGYYPFQDPTYFNHRVSDIRFDTGGIPDHAGGGGGGFWNTAGHKCPGWQGANPQCGASWSKPGALANPWKN